jgi:hypothetical protein
VDATAVNDHHDLFPGMAKERHHLMDIFEFISIKSWAATGEDAPGMIEGPAEVPHPIADAHLPEAASVFDAATALDTIMDMVDPQPTLVELLVRHVLLPRELLPQIEINSNDGLQEAHKRPGSLRTLRSTVV